MSVSGADLRVAALAAQQHGIVDLADLRACGVSREMRRTRLRRGALHVIEGCPGVFAVGHTALTQEALTLAAARACHRDAVVTGEYAEWLWDLRPPWAKPPSSPVCTIVPLSCKRSPEAATPRRRTLREQEWTLRRGIPVVTVERLLAEAGENDKPWDVERLLDRALIERRTSLPRLEAQLVRSRGCRGVRILRALVDADRRLSGLTRSQLEEAFLALLRRAEVELPELNHRLGRDLVDAVFESARVAVELDGTAWHRTRRRQEGDRRKEMRLRARGLLVVRYTARQVLEEPEKVVADLVRVLAGRPLPGQRSA